MDKVLISKRVQSLPPYLFSRFQEKRKELEKKGVDVIDLGIGAPDLPTPQFIIDQLAKEATLPENHRYSPFGGSQTFKEAVAQFYHRHYDVELNPNEEVLTLIGSKEGIHHLMQAVINPGDGVIVPDPGYPVYESAVHLAGGIRFHLPLLMEKGGIPQYDQISKESLHTAKLLLLNYPSNPTAATVKLNTFVDAITFAKENKLFLAHDAAYSLVTFGHYKAPSVLQVPDAKEHAIEFGSLSKSFNMTGWRIGYVVGNKSVIQSIATLKGNIDSGQFLPIQKAAAHALLSDLQAVKENNLVFHQRMELMYEGLTHMGIQVEKPEGTIFMWAQTPPGYSSQSFANFLLEKVGVIVTPGSAFGSRGEGFIRIALTVPEERLREVIARLREISW